MCLVRRLVQLTFVLVLLVGGGHSSAAARSNVDWTPSQKVPGYDSEAWPPILLPDRDHTVHALSSQWMGDETGDSVRAIYYNKWTPEDGWTPPIDVLLSPLKNEARLTGAYLDQSGVIHVTFFGGDGTDARIYYSQAWAGTADRATAWSEPIEIGQANDPEVASITGDGTGRLVIVFSSYREGLGLYSAYSVDSGETWSQPEPSFITYDGLFPVDLVLSNGESGVIHAVWGQRNRSAQGRKIIYAQLNLDEQQWTEPTVLAEAEEGYGVLIPTVVEHQGEVIVAYSGITIRRSDDGGITWTDPITPFRHTGVNGNMSFVADSNDVLHLLWAQRITGTPDIHGVWHSTLQGDQWSEPQAIVSGPHVVDLTGDTAFDPYQTNAVASQGNVLLATWRMDPGLKGNGVWFSYAVLDSPQYPALPFPTLVPTATPTETVADVATNTVATPTSAVTIGREALQQEYATSHVSHPAAPVVLALVPVGLLVAGALMQTRRTRNPRSK